MTELSVSIVIPVYNEERYLSACLDSLVELNYPTDKLEIILVDNGSTDRSVEIAKNYDVEVYIRPDVRVGAVRNYGVKHATGDVVVFLDSDCVVEPGWLRAGLEILAAGNDSVGGLYLLRENPSWVERYWILNSSKECLYQSTLVGGCIFIYKDAFEKLNGFDETLSAAEDSDLTYRLQAQGLKVSLDPALNVIHLGFPDTVGAFVRRQMWHSEDNYQKLPGILKDKIFILTHLYMFSIISLIVLFFNFSSTLLVLTLTCLVICPLVLSIKRIARFKPPSLTFYDLLSIYWVDSLYLIGRILGSYRSCKKILSGHVLKKYARR